MGRFSVKIGQTFEIENVNVDGSKSVAEVADAVVNVAHAAERSFVLKAAVCTGLVFICVAAIHGLYSGEFSYLANVWMVVGPLLAAICAYYFQPYKDTG